MFARIYLKNAYVCATYTSATLVKLYSRLRGYKSFFMLNSVEHGILNANKYKNIKKFSFFQTQISRECYFSCSHL